MALERWEEEAVKAYRGLAEPQRRQVNLCYKRDGDLTHETYNRAIAHAMRDSGFWPEQPTPMVGAEEYEETMLAQEIFEEVEGGGLEAQVDDRV